MKQKKSVELCVRVASMASATLVHPYASGIVAICPKGIQAESPALSW
ncbi:MAG TPA: hypothetical protein PK358_17000 [Spirochaetota bacterium]|nr:hypothetical protein [Spirochaetota bacterium]